MVHFFPVKSAQNMFIIKLKQVFEQSPFTFQRINDSFKNSISFSDMFRTEKNNSIANWIPLFCKIHKKTFLSITDRF